MDSRRTTAMSRAAYLRSLRRDRALIWAGRVLLLLALIALWEGATRAGAIDPFIFSSPGRILRTVAQMAHGGELYRHIWVTLWETCLGFALGTGLGVATAVVLWWFPRAAKVADPYLVILNSLPKIALGPVVIVWMGTGMRAIVSIAVLVSVFVSITSVLTGFQSVSGEKLMLMRAFGAGKWQMLRMVVLPANVPTMVSALKLSVGMSWVGTIVGEFLISRAGLGYLIVYGGQVFKLDIVMSSVVILCTLAGAMYGAVALFERRVTRRGR
ncbi:MAG: ABC transporter permease [Clostridiales bacterium]|nr:ABC transporter permease [Clostridiales bacterium]